MTKIEWTHRPGTTGCTWNPIRARNSSARKDQVYGVRGWHCEHVSEACRHCYAERINLKEGATGGTGFGYKPSVRLSNKIKVYLDENTVHQPLHWNSPRTIFCYSMTDIFGTWVEDEWLFHIFAIAARCWWHTFIVLTKRPDRMQRFLADPAMKKEIDKRAGIICLWPLANLWVGVTAEDQETAAERIPLLINTPAAIRFVSCEPMLGAVDLSRWLELGGFDTDLGISNPGLAWVICGGETGKNARPMHPYWAWSLRDQCKAASVPFFFKQNGEFIALDDDALDKGDIQVDVALAENGRSWKSSRSLPPATPVALMARIGKKRAGRLLAGCEHSEFPDGAA